MKLKRFIVSGMGGLAMTAAVAQEAVPSYTSPQDSLEYRKEMEAMMTLSGSENTYELMIPQLKSMIRSQVREGDGREMALGIVDDIFDTFAANMLDILIPIYRKYFTTDDIRKLNEFYKSPFGQKFAASAPGISVDAMQAGQRYAQEKVAEALRTLKEKKLLREI